MLAADARGVIHADGDVPFSGSLEVRGRSIRLTQEFTATGNTQTSEQRRVNDAGYHRGGSLPWQRVSAWSGEHVPPTLAEALLSDDMDRDVVDGTLRLRASDRAARPVIDALLLLDPSQTVEAADVEAVADLDGTLRTLDVSVDATVPGQGVMGSSIRYTFDPGRRVGTIMVPSDVWVLQVPGRGYAMMTPLGWHARIDERLEFYDTYIDTGATIAEIGVTCLNTGESLDAWTKVTRKLLTEDYGAKPTRTLERTVSGVPARVLEWAHATVADQDTFVVNVSVVKDGYGCDVTWFNDPGTETADRTVFDVVLQTFVLLGR